jgi:hypothetical protein
MYLLEKNKLITDFSEMIDLCNLNEEYKGTYVSGVSNVFVPYLLSQNWYILVSVFYKGDVVTLLSLFGIVDTCKYFHFLI